MIFSKHKCLLKFNSKFSMVFFPLLKINNFNLQYKELNIIELLDTT